MFKTKRLIIWLLALVLATPMAPLPAMAVFSDVSSSHPNYEAITYLRENGIVEGYADNTFQPDKPVNRAEALKIILLGSGILVPEIQNQDIFPDVLHGTWYAKYAAKAKNLSVVSGDSTTGMFRPGDTVNLAEILKILLRANGIESDFPQEAPYADVPTDAWFAPYFGYASDISLLDAYHEDKVYPAQPVNRGLMAELMYRLSQKPQGYQEGTASYYGEKFHGKTTASGEVFDASDFTAAHRTLPFNSWLKVTNMDNGKGVMVRVTDRGPYAGDNRIIDLSKAAFEAISPLSRGVIPVSIVPATSTGPKQPSSDDLPKLPDSQLPKLPGTGGTEIAKPANCPVIPNIGSIEANGFENITLDGDLANAYAQNEILTLKGSVKGSATSVSAFLMDSKGKQYPFYGPVQNSNFSLNLSFPGNGAFRVGVLPGESGGSIIRDLAVLPSDCFDQKEVANLPAPTNLSANLMAGDTVFKWNGGNYEFFRLTFKQGSKKKSIVLRRQSEFRPNYNDFVEFSEGPMELSVQGADADSAKSVLEIRSVQWSAAQTISFQAALHHQYNIEYPGVIIKSLPDTLSTSKSIQVSFDPKVNVRTEAEIILPNGSVEQVELISGTASIEDSKGIRVIPQAASEVSMSYLPKENKIHFVEINDDGGLAIINVPIYPSNLYPLIPSPFDLTSREPVDLGSDTTKLRSQALSLLNSDRESYGRSKLTLDSNLTQLAQYRADDMAQKGYFSHWDANGDTVNDLKKNFAINQQVAENLAKEVNLELAQYGLMRSALHRSNLLDDEWTRVGLGIAKASDGSYLVVQVFSSDPINLSDIASLRQLILSETNKERGVALTQQPNLDNLAQAWSMRMVDDDFFDFTAPNNETLVGTIHNAGVSVTLGTYIIGNTSLADALDQLRENTQIADPRWKKMGIGVVQDQVGVIKITLIYTE